MLVIAASLFLHPGFIIVDHIHFQVSSRIPSNVRARRGPDRSPAILRFSFFPVQRRHVRHSDLESMERTAGQSSALAHIEPSSC